MQVPLIQISKEHGTSLHAWREFDLENVLCTVSACRMKKKREHLVPFAKQVGKHFTDLKEFSTREMIFPSSHTKTEASAMSVAQ